MNWRGQTNWVVVCAAVSASFSFGQVTTGTIMGTVTDSNGAVVPNSNVTVRNVETGITRTVMTDSTGSTGRLPGAGQANENHPAVY